MQIPPKLTKEEKLKSIREETDMSFMFVWEYEEWFADIADSEKGLVRHRWPTVLSDWLKKWADEDVLDTKMGSIAAYDETHRRRMEESGLSKEAYWKEAESERHDLPDTAQQG